MGAVSVFLGIDVVPLLVFLVWTGIVAWLIFFGGVEWAEESYVGALLLGVLWEASPDFPSRAIKWFVATMWAVTLVGLIAMCALSRD